MPETKQILVYFEGDDDKAFLEKLRAARLLAENCKLAGRSKEQHPGKDGLVRQLLPFVRPASGVGGTAVVLVDLDELTFEQRFLWFRNQVQQELQGSTPPVSLEDGPAINERVRLLHLVAEGKTGRIALIPVGLPGDPQLAETYKIDRFAIDDWLLRLIRNERVFAAVSDLRSVPYPVAMAKFIEVAELFRKNGLEARKSKTYVQILRALAAIAPSTATIVGRLVQKGAEALPPAEFRAILHPLLDDLEAALRALSEP
ncbi:MAG TPA: hypothetical protein VKA46_16625 [Gemmataceae bacterium]|nr:hypothetical protein [Gemmataceae bacterium]